jgi:hypothetical protein
MHGAFTATDVVSPCSLLTAVLGIHVSRNGKPGARPGLLGSIKSRYRRGVKRLYAILTMTALLGWMPIMLCLLLIDYALARGAREWAELTFDIVFIGLYFAFTALGTVIYSRLRLS